MNRYDLITYLIAGGAVLFGAALLAAAPVAFKREYAKDPNGAASGFAIVVDARPRYGRLALALLVLAMHIDAVRGAR